MKEAELDEETHRRLYRAIQSKMNNKRLPPFWRFVGEFGSTGIGLEKIGVLDGKQVLTAILEAETHDGADWWHLSIHGKPNRLPTWEEINEARAATLGADVQMIQVLAPRSEHYTIAEVLHVWARIDGARVVPDLRARMKDGTIGL